MKPYLKLTASTHNNSCFTSDKLRSELPEDVYEYVVKHYDKPNWYHIKTYDVVSLILESGYELKFVNDMLVTNSNNITTVYHFVRKENTNKILG